MSSTAQAVETFLSKIEQTKDLNIFLEVWADEAREKAQEVDEKIAQGTAGKLARFKPSLLKGLTPEP